MGRATAKERLSADDWQRVALEAIGVGGVDAVSVEGLARTLGVTKGSFYWHYANREALIAAALDFWEAWATGAVIDALDLVADPDERLRRLFTETFGGGASSALDVALLARVDDSVVGPVVRRVTRRRIEFVEATYRELGLPPARAARHARIVYALYVGHFQLRRTAPDDPIVAGFDRAYQRQLMSLLLSVPPR